MQVAQTNVYARIEGLARSTAIRVAKACCECFQKGNRFTHTRPEHFRSLAGWLLTTPALKRGLRVP